MQANVTNLTLIARCARNVLEMYSHATSDLTFDRFPNGACGATSDLMGRYLKETYHLKGNFVSGLRPDGTTHSWLSVNGIIIDITADQFGQSSVIVTESSEWHDTWETGIDEPPEAHHSFWPTHLGPAWAALLSGLSQLNMRAPFTAAVC